MGSRFFSVFRWAFRKTTSSSDAWVSTFEEQPEEFDLTIHQCLWHDTCVSCGCPEVCRFFCECDNYAFGDLKKVGFHRTQTLGTGGDCRDFHFYKITETALSQKGSAVFLRYPVKSRQRVPEQGDVGR